jgi:hypothetical protein
MKKCYFCGEMNPDGTQICPSCGRKDINPDFPSDFKKDADSGEKWKKVRICPKCNYINDVKVWSCKCGEVLSVDTITEVNEAGVRRHGADENKQYEKHSNESSGENILSGKPNTTKDIFCYICGTQLPLKANFCLNCGQSQQEYTQSESSERKLGKTQKWEYLYAQAQFDHLEYIFDRKVKTNETMEAYLKRAGLEGWELVGLVAATSTNFSWRLVFKRPLYSS